jgi:hypothetical protein
VCHGYCRFGGRHSLDHGRLESCRRRFRFRFRFRFRHASADFGQVGFVAIDFFGTAGVIAFAAIAVAATAIAAAAFLTFTGFGAFRACRQFRCSGFNSDGGNGSSGNRQRRCGLRRFQRSLRRFGVQCLFGLCGASAFSASSVSRDSLRSRWRSR